MTIASESSFLPKGAPEELKYYEITGIAGLSTGDGSERNIVWQDSCEEKEYVFYVLEEKKVGVEALNGKIAKRSTNDRFAFFTTDAELAEKQNIMLRKGDECIYAKVIRKESDGFIICFTSMSQNVNHA